MKTYKQLLALLALTSNMAQGAALDVKTVEELQAKIAQGKPTVVLVHYSQCTHCIRSMPHFNKAAEAPQNSDITFLKAETGHVHDLAKKLHISGTPTLLYYDKGQKLTQTTGEFRNPGSVTAPLRKYLQTGTKPSSQQKKPAHKPQRSLSRGQKPLVKQTRP